MFINNKLSKAVRLAITFGAASTLAFAGSLAAQTTDENVSQNVDNTTKEVSEAAPERIVVTGSRLRRAEFSNASPIQVISGDVSRELGLLDAASILQSTNQAAGQQIDNTFGGFVLDNGPGASTIGFRGLGAERTLVLINGRRMAPAGVGGAPTSPDLNLIPGVMIQRIENLFDGASTVYGSDAVAGVSNVILKKDVDGFSFQSGYRMPKGEGGQEFVLSGMWGKTTDKGFITVGAEYQDQKRQTRGGYAFTQGCAERIFETEDGRRIIRYGGVGPLERGYDSDTCDLFPLTNRVNFSNFFGSAYYTPGYTNIGNPNFSRPNIGLQFAGLLPSWIAADANGDGINNTTIIDGNGDGFVDVDLFDPFYAYQNSDYYRSGDYTSAQKRISLMVNGEYGLQDKNDTTFYFEGLYAKRESPMFRPGAQFFPTVSANNPYNPCGTNGINCNAVLAELGVAPGAVNAQPILNIRGDRDVFDIEVSQYRAVAGVTANFSALENIGIDNAYYDFYVSHSASTGDDWRQGIHSQRLAQSLDAVVNGDGSITCRDTSNGCVAVNLFAPNLYQEGGGRLTDAEAAYLFADRTMQTKVAQTVVNGFIGGDVFTLPWNNETVSGILGAEFRKDKISTNANDVATQGLLMFYFTDQGADGSRDLKEIFSEFELPLLRGLPFAHELTMTASGRISEESFYDAASTYSLKAVYRPVDWFTLRGTQGSSYRAPNLRERFLNGTTGFSTLADPCVVPDIARVRASLDPDAPLSYDPQADTRDANILAACAANGVDPTSLGLGLNGAPVFTTNTSTEVVTGGTTALSEETSKARTFGFVFEQPFTDAFDLTLSVTRFDIEVTNSIAEPSAAYSIAQCYPQDGVGNSAFCSRIQRDEAGRLDLIDSSFINIGLITSKGLDYNVFAQKDFVVAEKNLRLSLDVQATQMKDQLEDVLGTINQYVGRPTTPEWRGSAQFTAAYGDYRFNWLARYIGSGKNAVEPEFVANTVACTGLLDAEGQALKCRPIWYTDSVVTHTTSLSYSKDNYRVTFGVRNLFNKAPPRVDQSGVFSNTNIPLGVGYEGPRSMYLNFSIDM